MFRKQVSSAAFLNLFILFLSTTVHAQTANDYIKQGDEYSARFEHQKALDTYLQAHIADTGNCTALWKIAEKYVDLGEEADKSLVAQYFYTAEKWACLTVQQCPDEPNGHFFVAVSSGRLALFEGGKSKVNRSKEVKAEVEKTLELDPNHHGAYHALGRWHREIANLNWFLKAAAKVIYGGVPEASNAAAVEYFQKAISIKPDWISHHLHLGKTFLEMEQWQQAADEFSTALALPIADHEDKSRQKEALKLLNGLKKERKIK